MALDKAILHKKEYRKPYHGGKAVAHSCRNHGGCVWCEMNRKYKYLKKEKNFLDKLKEWEYN